MQFLRNRFGNIKTLKNDSKRMEHYIQSNANQK